MAVMLLSSPWYSSVRPTEGDARVAIRPGGPVGIFFVIHRFFVLLSSMVRCGPCVNPVAYALLLPLPIFAAYAYTKVHSVVSTA